MNGERFDKDSVDVDSGVDGVLPLDYGGVDKTLDQVVLGYLAPVESNTVGITFFLGGENQMIVSSQQDGDLSGVRHDGGSCISPPFGRSREIAPRTIVEIIFDG